MRKGIGRKYDTTLTECLCGCKHLMLKFDNRGRLRKYIHGHFNKNRHLSPTHIQHIKENRPNNSGENHPMWGKHHSEESKKKISDSNTGKSVPHTKEWNEKISISKYGKYLGENSPIWKGGEKASNRRKWSKIRNLNFNPVNEPLHIDDEVAHHLTKEFVAYVPEYINKSVYHNIHTGKGMDEVNFYTLNYLFLIYNKEN